MVIPRPPAQRSALGALVGKLMHDKGYRLFDLAVALGIDYTGLNNRLRGQTRWLLSETIVAARFLDVPVKLLADEAEKDIAENE